MTQPHIYDVMKYYWDWAYEHPAEASPAMAALVFFSCSHCNNLGWKRQFGLPTAMAMEAIGTKSWRTYSAAFEKLVKIGLFEVVERSKNQYSANVVAYALKAKAQSKALSKATHKHHQKQQQKQSQKQSSIKADINRLKDLETYRLTDLETREEDFSFLHEESIDQSTEKDFPSENLIEGAGQDRSDDIDSVLLYLNEVCRKTFPPTDWTARKLVQARLDEGYTVEQAKEVIELSAWKAEHSDFRRSWLTPYTIFEKVKFIKYVNEVNDARSGHSISGETAIQRQRRIAAALEV